MNAALLACALCAGAAPPSLSKAGGLIAFHAVAKTETVAVSPDGKRAACFDGWQLTAILDLEGGKQLPIPKEVYRERVWRGIFCPDGRLAVARWRASYETRDGKGNGMIHVFDLGTNKEAWSAIAHKEVISSLAVSPDGRWLATGGCVDDGAVMVWDLASGKRSRVFHFQDDVKDLSFSPSGRLLVAGLRGGLVRVLDTATWKLSREMKFGPILFRAMFVSEDRVAACWWNPWDCGLVLRDARPVPKLPDVTVEDGSYKFAACPKAGLLAVVLTRGRVDLHDLASGKRLCRVAAHAEDVSDLHFSADGKRLYTAGPEGLKVWSVEAMLKDPLQAD